MSRQYLKLAAVVLLANQFSETTNAFAFPSSSTMWPRASASIPSTSPAASVSPLFRLDALRLAPQQLGSFQELAVLQDGQHREERNVALHDWSSHGPIPFVTAWDYQKQLVDAHLDRLSTTATATGVDDNHASDATSSQFLIDNNDDTPTTPAAGVDSVVILQHDPVYTLGTASDPAFVLRSDKKVDTVRMDRGGEVTYHGPGQCVVYPILDLRGYNQDIHWYMRALEQVVLCAIDKAGLLSQYTATRHDDLTGVWIDNQKVAAVGIKARRWVTMHGLAVNVEASSLENFDGIVPCGLEGHKVACLNDFLQQPTTVQEFSEHIKAAIEDVFQVKLVDTGSRLS